jgi:uncharacterized membrane protein YjgN (DUF898 family)
MNTLITDDAAAAREPIDISFRGSIAPMAGLGLINGVLKVLTLGLYAFWAKTEVRRRLWSATRLNGEPLTYTGTGKELLLGFLIVFGVVVLPVLLTGFAVSLLFAGSKQALAIYQAVLYTAFFILFGNAIYRAQRYRLSRTEWRGIRGGLVGSPGRYGWAYFWTLAVPFTGIVILSALISYLTGPAVGGVIMLFGLLLVLLVLPWRANYLRGLITRDMGFGDRPLSYTGTAGPLYKRYLFAWLGNAVIFGAALAGSTVYVMQAGLYARQLEGIRPNPWEALPIAAIWIVALIASAVVTAWYRASQINHFAGHTHFEGATFRANVTGGTLMWLVLSNWLLSILSFIAGALIGGLLLYGIAPPDFAGDPAADSANAIALLVVLPPIIVMTTLAATLAQYRSARFFVSRLKLDGPVNLGLVMQSQSRQPKRGEGLAQVFDIDAF